MFKYLHNLVEIYHESSTPPPGSTQQPNGSTKSQALALKQSLVKLILSKNDELTSTKLKEKLTSSDYLRATSEDSTENLDDNDDHSLKESQLDNNFFFSPSSSTTTDSFNSSSLNKCESIVAPVDENVNKFDQTTKRATAGIVSMVNRIKALKQDRGDKSRLNQTKHGMDVDFAFDSADLEYYRKNYSKSSNHHLVVDEPHHSINQTIIKPTVDDKKVKTLTQDRK